MMNLKSIAQKTITISELYTERTALTTEELLGKELTIQLVDLVDTSDSQYSVCVFKECPTKFYNGGLILTKIIKSWILEAGSASAVNDMLAKEDVHIVLNLEKTRSKNSIVTVKVY